MAEPVPRGGAVVARRAHPRLAGGEVAVRVAGARGEGPAARRRLRRRVVVALVVVVAGRDGSSCVRSARTCSGLWSLWCAVDFIETLWVAGSFNLEGARHQGRP